MRALLLIVVAACQQESPAPRPIVVRDARVDAAPPLERDAPGPRLRVFNEEPMLGSFAIRFDSTVQTVQRSAPEPGTIAWRITLAGPVTILERAREETRREATSEPSRSFALDLPDGVALDVRVGQHLRGSIHVESGLMQYRVYGEAADDRSKVFEVGSGPLELKVGKVITDIQGASFERIHAVEVPLEGKTLTLAGWARWNSYAVFGLAGDIAEGQMVYDYFPWRAFAMIRQPG